MPAARILSISEKASVPVWVRAVARASPSTNDCTPKEIRLIPQAMDASRVSGASCNGAASSVISASGATSNCSRMAVNSARSSSGVPPPK